MATDRAPLRPWLLAIPTLLLLGCGGGADATATERLWVSGVPTSPKEPLTAFITTRMSDGKYLGAFFKGSLYRGGHDVFEWYADGKDTAHLKFLQDGSGAKLRIEKCEPTRGFDHCMLLKGDPTGTVKYQSRKRWVVRRPGKKKDIAEGLVTQTILDLAEDDEDLQALIEP
jgi:hypothetical protein